MIPCRLAYCPVTIDARFGEQIGVVWNARSNSAPSLREPVDVRRPHVGVAARAELVVAQVVDQDHEEVGFLHGRRLVGAKGECRV